MLTKQNLHDIYVALSEMDDLPDDAVDFVSMIANSCFGPDTLKFQLEHNLSFLKKYIIKDEERDMKRITFIEELIKVLFSDYEDVPLCINETFACIAKIRLEQSI
jgi:hypothetical protein